MLQEFCGPDFISCFLFDIILFPLDYKYSGKECCIKMTFLQKLIDWLIDIPSSYFHFVVIT